MKQFTKVMLDKLHNAHDEVKGTQNYTRYYMECSARTNGRWKFIGYSIPFVAGKIKTVKDKTYIVTKDGYGDNVRYLVTDKVKELLNI